jgi:hypothetical protein
MRVTRCDLSLCVFESPAASTQCFNFFRVQLHAAPLGMPETVCLSAQKNKLDIISAVDSVHARISGCVRARARVRECARVRMYVEASVGGGTSSACQTNIWVFTASRVSWPVLASNCQQRVWCH